ncbi:MAG: threonylcarbamoyl-AMP synthase [Candidatus Krumholzibacteriota bacterium]|nr:threonylcarbamoyl-AMP synthase [Candidatus Krumholzibacteriota bacterium]
MEKPITGRFTPGKIAQIARILREGEVVILPTDTIYGFHCIHSDRNAVRKIQQLKRNRKKREFVLLVSDLSMAAGLVSRWPGRSREVLYSLWPAPLTAILPASGRVPDWLVSRGKVALRLPDAARLRKLISLVREPLVSTSINLSGKKPLRRMEEIKRDFPGAGAYISGWGSPRSNPSTVVDYSGAVPVLLRRGGYAVRVDGPFSRPSGRKEVSPPENRGRGRR